MLDYMLHVALLSLGLQTGHLENKFCIRDRFAACDRTTHAALHVLTSVASGCRPCLERALLHTYTAT